MTLLPNERKSAVWLKVAQHINEQIEMLRRRNDGDLNEIETARLRGKIAGLKMILELGEDPPPIVADDQSA